MEKKEVFKSASQEETSNSKITLCRSLSIVISMARSETEHEIKKSKNKIKIFISVPFLMIILEIKGNQIKEKT